jgi:hypothetical protein
MLSSTSLAALMDEVTDTYEPSDPLEQVGVDADGLPMYKVAGRILTAGQAQTHLVEEGLADPETLK